MIDNASSDSTVEQIAQFGIPVTCNAHNVGYGAAHNQALRMTSSKYVLTLNPDVVLQPGFLAAMTDVLEADDRIGAAAGCLLRVDDLGAPPCCIDSAGLYMRRSRRQGLWLDGADLSQRPQSITPIFGPDGAAAFYRRAMLEDIAVNGEVFDEDFFIQKEDVDICWRAQLRGWRAVHIPGAVGHHVRSFRPGRRQTVDAEARRCAVRNRYLLLLKNETSSLFLRDGLFILLYDLAILVYLLLRERESLAAFRSLWTLRQRTLTRRRAIQSRRTVPSRDLAAWFRGPPRRG